MNNQKRRFQHKYVAHEVLVTSVKQGIRMVLFPLLICFAIQLVFLTTVFLIKIGKIQNLSFPHKRENISFKAFAHYFIDFSFGLSKKIMLPSEFNELFSQSKLSKYVDQSGRIDRSIYRNFLNSITKNRIQYLLPSLGVYFRWSCVIYIFFLLYLIYSPKKSKDFYQTEFIRGSSIKDKNIFLELLKQTSQRELENDKSDLCKLTGEKNISIDNINIKLGSIYIPRSAECKHFLILGSTGSGKSVLLNQIIAKIIERQSIINHKTLIYDIKGDFTSKHFRPGEDIIFYPYDKRSIHWNFFNEIKNWTDLDVLASSIFQAPPDARDEYWYDCAKEVFRAGLLVLYLKKTTKNRDIVRFFAQPLKDIRDEIIRSLPPEEHGALKHISGPDNRHANSIVSILNQRIVFFRYIIDTDGDFSFRTWVRNDSDKRNLFLLNVKENELVFKALMTMVIDCSIREVLSRPEIDFVNLPRITFIIDEFGSLFKLQSIIDFLTCARSVGGNLIAANQGLSSITHIYGEHLSKEWFNNFNSLAVLRTNDPYSSEYVAKALGQQEVLKKNDSHQMSPSEVGDRFSLTSTEKIEDVVLPSELQYLRDFNGFIKISGCGLSRFRVKQLFFPKKNSGYVPKDMDISSIIGKLEARKSPPENGSSKYNKSLSDHIKKNSTNSDNAAMPLFGKPNESIEKNIEKSKFDGQSIREFGEKLITGQDNRKPKEDVIDSPKQNEQEAK